MAKSKNKSKKLVNKPEKSKKPQKSVSKPSKPNKSKKSRNSNSKRSKYVSKVTLLAFLISLLSCGGVSTLVLLNSHYLRRLAEDSPFYESGVRTLEIWILVLVSFTFSIFVTIITQKNRELKNLNEKLEKMAISDPLTGIYNSQYFMNAAANQLSRISRSSGTEAFIIAFEIDDFKEIIDTHGRPTGNKVLRESAERISEKLRPYDIFARCRGRGERFLIFVSDIEREHIVPLTERVGSLISKRAINTADNDVLFVAASFGIAAAVSADKLEESITLAETAMLEAKASADERIIFAEGESTSS